MHTVWVIEQGTYSDYRVVGVFSIKAKAERILEALKVSKDTYYDEPTIAEWPLNPGFAQINARLDQWRVLMLRDGSVEDAKQVALSSYNLDGAEHLWERTKAPAYAGKGVPDALDVVVWAKDKKHAIKIVNERRAQMIATEQWPLS